MFPAKLCIMQVRKTFTKTFVFCPSNAHLKAGTHEGACPAARSCNTLACLHQRYLAKKYVAQQNFCSRVLLSHIKLVWYEGASFRGKSVARVCFRSKLPRVYWKTTCLQLANQIGLFFHPQLQGYCELTFKMGAEEVEEDSVQIIENKKSEETSWSVTKYKTSNRPQQR